MNLIDVSIIIINYNTFELTKSCILSIYEKTRIVKFEVILVDNASTEVDAICFLELFPDLVLIRNNTNQGFGRGNNKGMKAARGKYFLLLNSDAFLLNNAIDIAFEYAELNTKRYQAFGADLRNADLTEQRGFYMYKPISLLNTVIKAVVYENVLLGKIYSHLRPHQMNDARARKIGGLYGAYIFLNRIIYDDLGGFDPDFFMYCEDTEWFRNRINKKYGIDICYGAQVVHLEERSSELSMVKKNNILSYYLYWYKIGYLHYFIFVIFSYLNIIPNLLILPFMKRKERERNFLIIKYRLLSLKKVLFDIPLTSNKYGARKASLMFD